MQSGDHITKPVEDYTLSPEANAGSALFLREEREKMARRRYQEPEPKQHGKHWTIGVTEDYLQNGQPKRWQKRIPTDHEVFQNRGNSPRSDIL